MKNFDCCNELMSLILNPEIGEIILKCESCKNEIRYYYEDKMKLGEDLDDYLKLMKKNIMWFENVKVYEKVKLIGKNSKNEDVIAITEVTNQNRVQVNKDLELIKNLKDKSLILGDDVPSLNLPFEEEGLVCKEIEIEIFK